MTDVATPSPAPGAPAPSTAQPSAPPTLAPVNAQARIAELRKDGDFAARYLKGDKGARDEMTRLHQQAYPDATADDPGSDPNASAGDPGSEQDAAGAIPVEPASEADRERHAMQAGYYVAGALQEAAGAGMDHGTARFYGQMLTRALSNPPSAEQVNQLGGETMATLQQAYPGKVEQILADARAEMKHLSASIPQLPEWMDITGGGNDLHVILQLSKRHRERVQQRIVAGVRGRRA